MSHIASLRSVHFSSVVLLHVPPPTAISPALLVSHFTRHRHAQQWAFCRCHSPAVERLAIWGCMVRPKATDTLPTVLV
jgi:hypothetical protein